MAEAQGTTESATQDKKGGAPVQDDNKSWLSRPENLGNATGDKIQNTLQPVGNAVGNGLSYAVKPVGNVVDGVVGGVMRSGGAVGESIGVGVGNKDGGPGKIKERNDLKEREELRKGIGGNEQNAGNPLGL